MEKSTVSKRVLTVLVAVLLFVVAFFAGFAVCYFRGGADDAKALWIKNMIDTYYYEDIDPDDVYSLIGEELLDPYSDYYDETAYAELSNGRKGNKSGFGFSYYIPEGEDVARVYAVSGNSPAERAGLRAGMRIFGAGRSEDEIVSVSGSEFSAYFDSLGLEDGDTVFFETDAGIVSVTRGAYKENCVFYRDADCGYRFVGEDALDAERTAEALALPDDTAYIRITSFSGNVAQQFAAALEIFKDAGKKHLILDLRGNGGGLLSDLQKVASYLLKDAEGDRPLVVRAKYKNGKTETYRAAKNEYRSYFAEDSRVWVLADSNTASASECLIGAMLDYGTIGYGDILLSEIDGVAKTYGKGIMQSTFQYIDGSAIKLTTATVHWPVSDNNIHGRGVLPQDGAIAVAATAQPDTEEIESDLLRMVGVIAANS